MPSSASLENDLHVKVDHAIEGFLKNLSQIGPELLSVSDFCFRATLHFFHVRLDCLFAVVVTTPTHFGSLTLQFNQPGMFDLEFL